MKNKLLWLLILNTELFAGILNLADVIVGFARSEMGYLDCFYGL
ncbi:hypothetical protein ACOWLX_06775 [Helicobacter pylori]